MRRSIPWKFASARTMAASSISSSLPTAIAASALRTLCRPAMFSVTASASLRPRRLTSNNVRARSRRTSRARTSASAFRP